MDTSEINKYLKLGIPRWKLKEEIYPAGVYDGKSYLMQGYKEIEKDKKLLKEMHEADVIFFKQFDNIKVINPITLKEEEIVGYRFATLKGVKKPEGYVFNTETDFEKFYNKEI